MQEPASRRTTQSSPSMISAVSTSPSVRPQNSSRCLSIDAKNQQQALPDREARSLVLARCRPACSRPLSALGRWPCLSRTTPTLDFLAGLFPSSPVRHLHLGKSRLPLLVCFALLLPSSSVAHRAAAGNGFKSAMPQAHITSQPAGGQSRSQQGSSSAGMLATA